jgi:hypothetical protein
LPVPGGPYIRMPCGRRAPHRAIASGCRNDTAIWRNGSPERGPRGPAKRGSGSGGNARDRASVYKGRPQPATGVASSSGRHCFALRGLARLYRNQDGTGLCGRAALPDSWRRGSTIRVVAFRASHPAKPPSRPRWIYSEVPS